MNTEADLDEIVKMTDSEMLSNLTALKNRDFDKAARLRAFHAFKEAQVVIKDVSPVTTDWDGNALPNQPEGRSFDFSLYENEEYGLAEYTKMYCAPEPIKKRSLVQFIRKYLKFI